MSDHNNIPGEDRYSLIWKFPDQSPVFARGFVCGELAQKMRSVKYPFEFTMLSDHVEDAISLATVYGWTERVRPLAEGWVNIYFVPESRS